MMNNKRWAFCLVLLGILIGLQPVPSAEDENIGLGLKLATPERLRGVPLAYTPYSGTGLPSIVDLSKDMPPPGHQGNQNSCVAWTVAYALKSYQEKLEEKLPLYRNGRLDPNRIFSPSFVWNQLNNGQNIGIYYENAFNLLTEQGAATWTDMPWTPSDITSQPSAAAKQKAGRYRIAYWRQVNVRDLREVKAHLAAGYPVLIGANVDQAFIRLPAGTTWNSIGTPIGGHAMIVVGYDDNRRAFRFMNSWGSQWADGGFCWVDYEHFLRVVNEGYVVKDAQNGAPPVITEQQQQQQQIQVRQPSLTITSVQHNTSYQDKPELGYYMRFEGTLEIPPNFGRTDRVVIHFYFDTGGGVKGRQIPSLDRQYVDINGYAACGTAAYAVPAQGLRTQWKCWIPYKAFNTAVGQWIDTPTGRVYQYARTNCIAVASLFVDNYGVARGPGLRFVVRK